MGRDHEDEHLDGLLDKGAHDPTNPADPTAAADDRLASLLHAAATTDPARALRGEEAAVAAFRAARRDQPEIRRRIHLTWRPRLLRHPALAVAVTSALAAALLAAALVPELGRSRNSRLPALNPLTAAQSTTARPQTEAASPRPLSATVTVDPLTTTTTSGPTTPTTPTTPSPAMATGCTSHASHAKIPPGRLKAHKSSYHAAETTCP